METPGHFRTRKFPLPTTVCTIHWFITRYKQVILNFPVQESPSLRFSIPPTSSTTIGSTSSWSAITLSSIQYAVPVGYCCRSSNQCRRFEAQNKRSFARLIGQKPPPPHAQIARKPSTFELHSSQGCPLGITRIREVITARACSEVTRLPGTDTSFSARHQCCKRGFDPQSYVEIL